MRILAVVPLIALMSAPASVQAQSGEEPLEGLIELALQERHGARLGLSLGSWEEEPVEGLEVDLVTPGGPAEQAGLKAGDLLTSIDAESLAGDSSEESYEKLRGMLAEMEPGREVTVGFRRDGEDIEVQVTTEAWQPLVTWRSNEGPRRFGQRAENWARRLANSFSGGEGDVDVEVEMDGDGDNSRRIVRMWRGRDPFVPLSFYDVAWRLQGLQVAELTPALGEYFGAEYGLLVVRAPDDEEIGLEDGDVIRRISGREFRDARHATRILRSYEPGEEVELEVLRHKRSKTVRFQLPEREFPQGEMFTPPWSGPDGALRDPMLPRGAN